MQSWAMEVAAANGISSFKASDGWTEMVTLLVGTRTSRAID